MRAADWGARPRASVPVVRLLLFGLMVLGVIQMHSLGHGGHDEQGAGWPMAAAHAAEPMPSGPAPVPPAPGPGTEVSPDLLGMCLAILTSLGLLGALTALLAARPEGAGGRRDGPLAILLAGRGPPAVGPPIGRRLACVSVLRI